MPFDKGVIGNTALRYGFKRHEKGTKGEISVQISLFDILSKRVFCSLSSPTCGKSRKHDPITSIKRVELNSLLTFLTLPKGLCWTLRNAGF